MTLFLEVFMSLRLRSAAYPGSARLPWVWAAWLLCTAAAPVCAVGFKNLESQVRQFSLPNGVTFVVLERHDAPVFSYRTYVDAGGVDEVAGITGVAHMFEHMAFKGTQTVGTTDYEAEKMALDAVDAAWDSLAAEMRRGAEADSARLKRLDAAFKAAQEAAGKYVVSNEYSKVLEENGAADLNAFTTMDATQFEYSLPSNRLELWARMEGDRLTQPVLREFYKEREVVQEERRFQESTASGRLFSVWWSSCFLAHPYGNGLIGFPSDLKQITRNDARRFFDGHYVGSNITVAVVGDVTLDDVRRLAEKYFSGIRSAPKPLPVRTAEPPHDAEIRVTMEEDAQPQVLVGYLIPSAFDRDWPAYTLLGDILSSGRSSRLYERLVKKDRTATEVFGATGFPGDKYPNILIFAASMAKDAAPEQAERAMYEELDRLIRTGPSAEELQKVKREAKSSFIQSVRSNEGLSGQLAEYQGKMGDWRRLFRELDRLDTVRGEDIRRVARAALTRNNRCVGVLRKPAS